MFVFYDSINILISFPSDQMMIKAISEHFIASVYRIRFPDTFLVNSMSGITIRWTKQYKSRLEQYD